MIRAHGIGLRARLAADTAVLHAELYDDVAGQSRADTRPWRPLPADSAHAPYAVRDPSETDTPFSVVELAGGELIGEAIVWGIDTHNRFAHLGVALRPAHRGRGLGGDVVRALCHYGFVVRGFHRLQLETLADNAAMIAAAEKAGFVHEGTLRRAAWVYGEWLDEVVYGLLSEEWSPLQPTADGHGK
ncbi:GNAT family N-acetyltransferase [Streptomyces sp. NPDC093225]|uniref:GNAT family N-acetyltransferase n=1 Tax=Streptomyces sp. NPDC093225 TaxID=3366034 RepID=UPI0038212C15